MGIYEKYKWFLQGTVKAGTSEKWQKFFKTNPSEDQIQLLDEIYKNDNMLWLIAVLLYFIGGLMVGWVIWNQIPMILSKLAGA
jgi:fatty-acid desaturase